MTYSMKVPRGYEAYKRMILEQRKKREKFEEETEWKTKGYIA